MLEPRGGLVTGQIQAARSQIDLMFGEESERRMYPYTLLPDGHTLEPEDVVKPPATPPPATDSPHLGLS